MRWNPELYRRFASERARPFADLIEAAARRIENPRTIVDLGCGSGELTASLAERWPGAYVTGIDSSPEMTDDAARAHSERFEFVLKRIEDFTPDPRLDLLVSNAALQWVPDHRDLLAGWLAELAPGAVIGVQVPGNFRAPSHALMREIAESQEFTDELHAVLRGPDAVAEPGEYLELLADASIDPDVWETTYSQLLTGTDPVLEWVRGTALRPVYDVLSTDRAAAFERLYAEALRTAYPPGKHGTVFEFRRVFFTGRKPG